MHAEECSQYSRMELIMERFIDLALGVAFDIACHELDLVEGIIGGLPRATATWIYFDLIFLAVVHLATCLVPYYNSIRSHCILRPPILSFISSCISLDSLHPRGTWSTTFPFVTIAFDIRRCIPFSRWPTVEAYS